MFDTEPFCAVEKRLRFVCSVSSYVISVVFSVVSYLSREVKFIAIIINCTVGVEAARQQCLDYTLINREPAQLADFKALTFAASMQSALCR